LTLTLIDNVTITSAKISWHYIFNVKLNNPKKYISKWPLQGPLSLLRTRKFVRQKTGAGGYLLLCHNSWHSPFKARNLNKKSNKGRIITISGLLSWLFFSFIIGPLLLKLLHLFLLCRMSKQYCTMLITYLEDLFQF
jgi:hypothetical protein